MGDNPANSQTQALLKPKSRFSRIKDNLSRSLSRKDKRNSTTVPSPPSVVNVAAPAASTSPQPLGPIHGLWNEAYESLRISDRDLIVKYEARLTPTVQGLVSQSLPVEQREEVLRSVVEKNLLEYKKSTLKLKALGSEIAAKDLAKPVLGIIKWADTYISAALAANPVASIAWAGVSVFLPVS